MVDDLRQQYDRRFAREDEARRRVWNTLIDEWFSRYLEGTETVLDLGCGWGHFVNQVDVPTRYGLDLNPASAEHLHPDVVHLAQAADQHWPLPDASLDLVFTSNFLEHLTTREAVSATLDEAHRCLRPGGRIVAMGPNIKYVGGAYWDFFDHLVPLTEASLVEALDLVGFEADEVIGRFLPYTMAGKPPPPPVLIRAYLKLRPAWRVIGRQFLVVAHKPAVEGPDGR